jgi:hypothetical protein
MNSALLACVEVALRKVPDVHPVCTLATLFQL